MKRMLAWVLTLLASLAVCGWLVRRHQRGTPPPVATRSMDRLQESVRIERDAPYTTDEAVKRRLMEKLQEQERKQRPEEGRN